MGILDGYFDATRDTSRTGNAVLLAGVSKLLAGGKGMDVGKLASLGGQTALNNLRGANASGPGLGGGFNANTRAAAGASGSRGVDPNDPKFQGPSGDRQRQHRGNPTDTSSGGDRFSPRTLEELFAMLDAQDAAQRASAGAGYGFDPSALIAGNRESAARLKALYDSAVSGFDGSAEAYRGIYDEERGTLDASSANAASSVDAAYSDSMNDREAMRKALGIEEAGLAINDSLSNGQATAKSNLAQQQSRGEVRNAGHRANSLTFNEDIKSATRVEGTNAQAALEQQLQQAIAEGQANAQAAASKAMSSAGMSQSQKLATAKALREQDIDQMQALYGGTDYNTLYEQALRSNKNMTPAQAATYAKNMMNGAFG